MGINEYVKRIGAFVKLEIVELPDVSLKTAGTADVVKQKEAEVIQSKLDTEDYVILLDEAGEGKTSLEFSSFLSSLYTKKHVVFVIGGVYGSAEALRQRANICLSLSPLTFTHRMVRLILVEQIYRALMIQANRSYHY